MSNICKSCAHYGFYQMITNGPYGYSGVIPCLQYSHFNEPHSEYTPITITDGAIIGDDYAIKDGVLCKD